MIIDGKKIAEEMTHVLRARVLAHSAPLTLAIISIAPNFATEKYLNIKRRVANTLGVELVVSELPHNATTDGVLREIAKLSATHTGVVLQLPYPDHIAIDQALAALPRRCDVDAIGTGAVAAMEHGDWQIMPPVVGAIAAIAREQGVSFAGKRVVVVGHGRLVGKPAALWAAHEGSFVTTITKESVDHTATIGAADILILGAGVSGLVAPSAIKDGVAVFDAGASEDGGRLVGDADPRCAEKASLFTPVPGGIGPIAVVKLFENLLTLSISNAQLDHTN